MKGPSLRVSEETHAEKYRLGGESFEQLVYRLAGTLNDGEEHRRALKDILGEMRFLPGGRIQNAVGSPRKTTAFNCLGGDTLILTREYGAVPIEEVANELVTLLDGNGVWVKCLILCHGEQTTVTTLFNGGFDRAEIRSTLEHGWVSSGGANLVKTKAFGNGKSKKMSIQDLRPSKTIQDKLDYKRGVIHGIIYGDGTHGDGVFTLRICSNHEDTLEWFDDFPKSYPPSFNGDPCVYAAEGKAWSDFKALPNPSVISLDYLLGFLRGWFLADGCVSTQPDATICCGSAEHEWLTRYAPLVGWQVKNSSKLSSPTNYGERNKDSGNVHLLRSSLDSDDFLLTKHRKRWENGHNSRRGRTWRVRANGYDQRVEKVYCPVVPTTHSFALACGIHSGNCFVSGTIDDDMLSIMARATEAAETMRRGGGIGFDFSRLRPRGELISTLRSRSSGPVSFMGIYEAVRKTICSAGHRRGAIMGVLRVDHPDIERFVMAKQTPGELEGFNVSVGVTDEFMRALESGSKFPLRWGGKTYDSVDPQALWDMIMRSTWDFAEPGVLFLDTINRMNNLRYCENISATNPCFTGNQKIWTAEGQKSFSELDGTRVKVLTETVGGKLVYRDMDVFKTAVNQEVIRVTLDDGTKIDCTPHHEFFTLNRERVEACDLVNGDRLASVYRHNANSKGYKRLTNGIDNPLEHRVPFEIIPEGFHVHHKNEIKDDNRLSNLELVLGTEHNSFHMKGDRNPSRRYPEKNHFRNGFYKEANGRWRNDVTTDELEDMRKHGMSYKEIAEVVKCSKYMVMNRLGWSRPNHKVVSVESLNQLEDVYCGTVDETHKFFLVCENGGVLVSNCGEQPLPPHGACLLGSFNLVKYITHERKFDWAKFANDIPPVVRAMDNVIDRTVFPLPEQEAEAKAKRRMGLGITGLANTGEILGKPYASEEFLRFTEDVLQKLAESVYEASSDLAAEKGSFPLFDSGKYLNGQFVGKLKAADAIARKGIRNSHLTSIAPTGTISLCADNISSGIEPPFRLSYEREIVGWDDNNVENVTDYAFREYGVVGKTAKDLSAREHLSVVAVAQKWVDSSISKTCNVGPEVSFAEFRSLYYDAWKFSCKGLTTFRDEGKRKGILREKIDDSEQACRYDAETGTRTCE